MGEDEMNAHWSYPQSTANLEKRLVTAFGNEILDRDGKIDQGKLAKVIETHPDKVKSIVLVDYEAKY